MQRASFCNLSLVNRTEHRNSVQRPITCNMGMKMPGWYDIINMEGINSQEDEEGVLASAQCVSIHQLLCPVYCN